MLYTIHSEMYGKFCLAIDQVNNISSIFKTCRRAGKQPHSLPPKYYIQYMHAGNKLKVGHLLGVEKEQHTYVALEQC